MREDEPWTFMPRVEECLNDERFSERQVRNDLEAKNIQGGGPSKSQQSKATSKSTTPKNSSVQRANPPNPT